MREHCQCFHNSNLVLQSKVFLRRKDIQKLNSKIKMKREYVIVPIPILLHSSYFAKGLLSFAKCLRILSLMSIHLLITKLTVFIHKEARVFISYK